MSVEPPTPTTADPTTRPEAVLSPAPSSSPSAAPDADRAATEKPGKRRTPEEPPPYELKLLGESKLDRVTSMLMSGLIGVCLVVGWIGVLVYSQRTFAERPPVPLEIIEVEGGGGGSPDGEVGATLAVNVSGAEAADMASNNMEDASVYEEPSIEMTSSAVVDALADVPSDEMMDVDIAEALPNAGMVATGPRASKIGTGVPFGYGGSGSGSGVAREQRWSLVFNPGQTVEEYARQLDYLQIELATIESATTLVYAKNFTQATPVRYTGLAGADKRLYFLWQGAGRKAADVTLLGRAGIAVGNKAVFQFIPKKLEDQLAQLEVRFAGRQPIQIRKTRFQVISQGGQYVVKVLSQEPLG